MCTYFNCVRFHGKNISWFTEGVILHVSEGTGGSSSEGGAGMVRLEHPRCAVMVEVLDQYTQIQRRLEPYLARYYQAMANDPVFSDGVSMTISLYNKFVVGAREGLTL